MAALAIDRRAALKARHRSAILEAARRLAEERGGAQFSVEELATQADVARRTVFNHFGSTREVLLALAEEALTTRIGDVVAAATRPDGEAASVFDELVRALRTSDLPTAIVTIERLVRTLGDVQVRSLTGEALARAADRLGMALLERHPASDPLRVQLLVVSLTGSVGVIAREWLTRHQGRLDAQSRADWSALLDVVVETVRPGEEDVRPARADRPDPAHA